jgi:hypothetical protein
MEKLEKEKRENINERNQRSFTHQTWIFTCHRQADKGFVEPCLKCYQHASSNFFQH